MAQLTVEQWCEAAEHGNGCVEVAKAFRGVGRNSVNAWIRSGDLPTVKVLGRWWTTVDYYRDFMARNAGMVQEAKRLSSVVRAARAKGKAKGKDKTAC